MSETNRDGSVVSFPSGSVQADAPYQEQPAVRLSPRISPVAAVVLALPFLYWLATVAFTPAGMQHFLALLVGHIQFLAGSAEGNRVATCAVFGVGVVGIIAFIRSTIVKHYGLGAFGYLQLFLGVALLCGAVGEWHLNQIGLLLMLGLGWAAYILIVWGWRNVQNDQGATYAPEFQAQELPEQKVYGEARPARDDEIHEVLRDRPRVDNRGYRYKR